MSREFADGAIVQPCLAWDSRPCPNCKGVGSTGPMMAVVAARERCPFCNGLGRIRANLRSWGKLLRRGDDPRSQDLVELYDAANTGTGWEGKITKETTRKFWRVEWADGSQSWVEEKNLEVIAGPEQSTDSTPA